MLNFLYVFDVDDVVYVCVLIVFKEPGGFYIRCQLRSSTQHLILMPVRGVRIPMDQGQIKLKKIQISALLVTKRVFF